MSRGRLRTCVGGQMMNMMQCYVAAALVAISANSGLAAPSCNAQKGMTVVDLSQPVTTIQTKAGKSGVEAFKSVGVKTIARYYDWPEDGIISCKVLLPAESNTLLDAGFSILTVYQNESDDPETFMKSGRGSADAIKAVRMAQANGQPAGSAIYFAVDGVDQTIKDSVFEYAVNKGGPVSKGRKQRLLSADKSFRKHIKYYERFRRYHLNIFKKAVPNVVASDMLPFVENHFREIKTAIAKSKTGYKIGAYGSGATCKHLQQRGLIDYCWLAMSVKWPGSEQQIKSGGWNLSQQLSTSCKGWKFREQETVHFDFNKVNSSKPNFGQWSKKGEIIPLASLPTSCTLRW
jgi:Domain of unknown function (DUF1906)